jgi:hypothetical protein
MKDKILCVIQEIRDDRRQRRAVPGVALLNEVIGMCGGNRSEVIQAMNGLEEEGKIEAGHAVNDRWLKIME